MKINKKQQIIIVLALLLGISTAQDCSSENPTQIDNCLYEYYIPNLGFTCMDCEDGYAIHGLNGGCFEVDAADVVDNAYMIGVPGNVDLLFCMEGFAEHVSIVDSSCIPNPTGGDAIAGCIDYGTSDGTNFYCMYCDDSSYMLNNAVDDCIEVTGGDIIAGCLYYIVGSTDADFECSECDEGYAYNTNDSTCEEVTPSDELANCSIYLYDGTDFSCDTCDDGYYIDSNEDCMLVPTSDDGYVENCSVYSEASAGVYECMTCQDKYFSEDSFATCERCANFEESTEEDMDGDDDDDGDDDGDGAGDSSTQRLCFGVIALIIFSLI